MVTTSVETSLTSRSSSEDDSTRPTTPLSAVPPSMQPSHVLKDIKTPARAPGLPLTIVPAIPNVPFIPRGAKRTSIGSISQPTKALEPLSGDLPVPVEHTAQCHVQDNVDMLAPPKTTPPPQKSAPKSWADLVRTKVGPDSKNSEEVNGNGTVQVNGLATSKTDSLFQALSSYKVDGVKQDTKLAFLEPRGLVNTGNMCYMNSVSNGACANQ